MPPPDPAEGGFELVSGPDLGGGFLHQLTVERLHGVHRFLFHAQEGGMDANGPPKGSPEPFGWRPSATMCPIGGRLCWHREFTLPISESLPVRTAYNRTRFVMEAMLAQEYGGVAVPFATGLEEVADRLNAVTPAVPWYVGGSLGLRVRGAAVGPRAAWLGTTPEAVSRMAEALRDFVTEPAAPTDWNGGPVLGARAFVGTLREGVRTGWAVPTDPAILGRLGEWTFLGHGVVPDQIGWHDRMIPVAPVEATLVRWAEYGREDRLVALAGWLGARKLDQGLLGRMLEGSPLDAAARGRLLQRA